MFVNNWGCLFDLNSVPVDLETEVPADGSVGRTEHSCHDIGQEEQDPRVLLIMAQDKDLQKWYG